MSRFYYVLMHCNLYILSHLVLIYNTDTNPMFEPKNYDNVFTRNLIVGLSSFLYDVIQIKQARNGNIELKRVPFFYSTTGEEQFIQDYFLNTDKYCNILSPKIEGNLVRVPSAVFSMSNAGINQQSVTSGYTRADYQKEFDTEFSTEERDMSARVDFIPLQFDFEAKVKAGSDIERIKIFEEIIKNFYKVKKFWIKYEGFQRLPVMVSFPDQYNLDKNFQFRYPDNEKRPTMIFNLQVVGYLPVVDLSTERFAGEKIDDFTSVITPRKPEICDDDNIDEGVDSGITGVDPQGQGKNDEYKLGN